MIEYNGEMLLNLTEIIKREPELRYENRSSITDDRVRKAVMSNHHINNYFRQSWSIDGDCDWLIIYYLSQVINYDENEIIAINFPISKQWQTGHKVY